MKLTNVSIVGVAHVEAPNRVTSQEIEATLEPAMERFGITRKILESLSGIRARRFWDPGTQPSEAATMAAEKVLEQTDLDRSKLGALINTSVSKDYIEPSTACLVHGNLKLGPDCMNMDVGNACLAFMNGMEIVGMMIERGQIDYGLVVAGEEARTAVESTISRILDPDATVQTYRDNFATLTLGSGGAAMILGRSDLVNNGHRILGSVTQAATQHNRLCLGQPDRMITDATALLKAGIRLAGRTWQIAQKVLNWPGDVLDHYMIHQISSVHTSSLVEAIGIDESKVYKMYPEFGNIGPVNLPMILSKSLEEGLLKTGHRIGLLGIGSGLNCSMMEVVW